ncbi:PAS domain S-box-containing protein/diguanylate cyclase (GGDEF)-like protein [Kushneria sinocarnis]|uniref:PAS domain S-box-containing protein/diguanylate cyclase (GGDEF)-like protein n=1 Tax=Kushneria sinocarnis TaxID=595502 RepID=A0A420WZ47_9GAMM|nr:EAL domain-containing protein [Kushneria sinocarnis]RKR06562.1 PAS domain S-box-containing protein/diguanylate cyclase (GGDEF)-like protein [Kushneria sinocarnis]
MADREGRWAMGTAIALAMALACGLTLLEWAQQNPAWQHALSVTILALLLLTIGYIARGWRRLDTELCARVGPEKLALAQRRHGESEQRFRALLESLPKVAVQGYDRERRVIYWNEASTQLYGYDAEEVQGELLEDLIIPEQMREGVITAHRNWIEHGTAIPAGELELVSKEGASVAVFSHHVMLGEHTADPLMFCVDVDLSDQKQARRELDFVTHFDPLTRLPNRRTFEAELEGFMFECQRRRAHLAVLFIDLDRFADVNVARGFAQGNQLLLQVADRLRQCQQESALLSRFDADEFVMAFAYLSSERDVLSLIDRILEVFAEPFVLAGSELHVTARLGVSLYPDNGGEAAELVHNAELAKNRAKHSDHSRYWFFNRQIHDTLVRQHDLLERLQRAIERGELCVHYQPQVAAASGRIENLEALVRWFPEGRSEPVPPSEFIPLAERFNLIHRLGDWIVQEVCCQQAHWKAEGLGGYRIDINFSGRQIAVPGVFDQLQACMQEYQLSHRDIGIELTENVLVQADDSVLEALHRLYHRGMKIAIDDFGTGYSTLSYLKLFPVTSLKIDRSFITDAPASPRDRAILSGMVFIAHRLGLEVVAEGVETISQLELIRDLNCDLVQGHYHFRPMPSHEVQRLMRDQPLINMF